MSKYLYTNGCSFTAGHTLELDDTWPFKLGELFNRKVYNKAVNGNSMFAISHTTFHHLQFLPPEDTIVIIGTTWEGRKGILFDNTSLTFKSYGVTKQTKHYDQLSTNRRICPVTDLDTNNRIKNKVREDWDMNSDFEKIIVTQDEAIQTLVKYDPYYERNIQLEYKYHLKMLESYLQNQGYQYLFVDFQKYYYPEKFISWQITENETSHPTAEDCTKLANFIYNKLSNE
jgi:hypothetical protein